ncbi:LacI family DNA-binding transcriptional regulator [Paraburkholderia edwinii]|uniref:LacI family DNA-binding transcriptional regulator n=1 Tax=Paraburkholderia edwinii TaxID=2861782 RepID=A0ABX8UX46_9BURK|nr:LacI family DNA-binding transcriptional regulator [Paraburkholderia edwinii]QYD73551.1 LacI family DNA-binding transcriptional regulator [Paraburkholderia edwinii]
MARAENSGDEVSSEPPPRRARGGSVTLRDVARFAGVSSATVSRVMNNPEAVSEQLRARIEVAIKHLGWVPSAAARALATQRTGTIGAIFPTVANEHYASAIQSLQEAFEQQGYTLLLGCSEYETDRELRQVRKMLERGVDAFVVVGDTHRPELYPLLEQRETPVVSTFNYSAKSHVPCVGVDNYRAFFDLTTYLLELGHRSFGMLAQSADSNDRARARREGVRDALAVQGLGMNPAHFVEGFWSVNEGRRLFRQVVDSPKRPTAMICGNGSFAMGAMLEAMSCGIDVPREMTIAGFDDFELMAELPIPITTVRVPSVEIGRKAAEMIIAQLDGKQVESLEFRAELIVRASSAPPPKKR